MIRCGPWPGRRARVRRGVVDDPIDPGTLERRQTVDVGFPGVVVRRGQGHGSNRRQHPDSTLRGTGVRRTRGHLTGPDDHEVVRSVHPEDHLDTADGQGIGAAPCGATPHDPPAHGSPRRARVLGVPEAPVAGGGIGTQSVGRHREVVDAARDAGPTRRLTEAHDRGPDGHPPAGGGVRRCGERAGPSPSAASGSYLGGLQPLQGIGERGPVGLAAHGLAPRLTPTGIAPLCRLRGRARDLGGLHGAGVRRDGAGVVVGHGAPPAADPGADPGAPGTGFGATRIQPSCASCGIGGR